LVVLEVGFDVFVVGVGFLSFEVVDFVGFAVAVCVVCFPEAFKFNGQA
jgi:hypothetical protein